jgi:protein transport protein SEC31
VAWGTGRSQGIVAGGSEHGELLLWDASAVVKSSEHALMASKNAHKGAVKGLDFNAVQPNTIATGASDGEVGILF